ncbi:unnamed protein product [Gongylonema pulchrum]|uniref:Tau95 domain-containing protein n=1 Tax=Gongylonema pulchrum TaxID=637853 RepID=A0A183EES2_9BILA|nr:unnamed protein product [Gongylonema pulchrum]
MFAEYGEPPDIFTAQLSPEQLNQLFSIQLFGTEFVAVCQHLFGARRCLWHPPDPSPPWHDRLKRVRGRFNVETRKLEKQLSELTDEDDWLKDLLKDEVSFSLLRDHSNHLSK